MCLVNIIHNTGEGVIQSFISGSRIDKSEMPYESFVLFVTGIIGTDL